MGLIPLRALSAILALLTLLGLNVGCARLLSPPMPETATLPQPGTLFLADGRHVESSELAALVASHDFILIGESHANACDHQFQTEALGILAQSGLPLALGLEMVPWSAQAVLDAFYQGGVELNELEEKLGWQDYWGYNFAFYRPILAQAKESDIPVYGLNVPKALLHRIRADGLDSIPSEERGLLPPALIPPPPTQRAMIEEEYHRHLKLMPDRTMEAGFDLERFMIIQSLWDTQMAHAAIQHREADETMVILTGAAHVEDGHGIAYRLGLLDEAPRILSLIPWRGGPIPDPTAGDFFFYCPEPPRRLGMLITWVDDQVVVTGVIPNSLAQEAGLQPGDVLLAADETPITALEVLHHAGVQAKTDQRPLLLRVLRDGDQITIPITSP
ncbi:ChaN family lipoprotein [Desulfonatronum thiodismutans]|uniref:ChaN family lipoprotein n=1 Tax=Desulfonatronum thiodismutans TaxID=159290 RepID=UPI000689B572|nr:ChaN family lipoprotein [Desulfonatronum thiodismutans]